MSKQATAPQAEATRRRKSASTTLARPCGRMVDSPSVAQVTLAVDSGSFSRSAGAKRQRRTFAAHST
jgi:hypothetical protein